jgi:hypothetical protein
MALGNQIGCNPISLVRPDKNAYRRDLEDQIEQKRVQKEAERKAYRSFTQHPLGASYNPPNMDSEVGSDAGVQHQRQGNGNKEYTLFDM